MVKEKLILDGQRITSIKTLGSMYDHNSVEVSFGKKYLYRMPMSTVIQMVNEFMFKGEKKRKYIHLTEAILKK